jgi:glutamine amidotransferase
MIGIIDYGMGNLRSVANAFRYLGAEVQLISTPADVRKATGLVLPGVGAFGDGIKGLRNRELVAPLEEEVLGNGRPFLGICLGMQLLATTGMEHGQHQGLGWISGIVDKLPIQAIDPSIRIPHIGWNDVDCVRTDGICAGLGKSASFYFVHSYHLVPDDSALATGLCEHGIRFAAIIEKSNIMATQFHPEKSQHAGLTVLRNFLHIIKDPCSRKD